MTVAEFEEMLTVSFRKYTGKKIKNDHFKALTVTAAGHSLLDRKTAASIIHEFLLDVLNEKDNSDVGPALELKDIYDCRVCAAHIAQVYCKGIMGINESRCFDLSAEVTESEALKYTERVFDTRKRIILKELSDDTTGKRSDIEKIQAEKISTEKCKALLSSHKSARLIDVRSRAEYANGHFDNAVNIPMDEIVRNPYGVSKDKDACLMLWCEGGLRSEMTAKCLIEAGYRHVCIVRDNA